MIFQDEFELEQSLVMKVLYRVQLNYRKKIDRLIIYFKLRWFVFIIGLLFYIKRVIDLGAFYMISLILSISLISYFIQYLSPLGVPEVIDFDDEDYFDDDMLPTQLQNDRDSSRPLLRQISEFSLWQNSFISVLLAIFCTFSEFFDFPIFWPFLLVYFLWFIWNISSKYRKHKQKFKYSFGDFQKSK